VIRTASARSLIFLLVAMGANADDQAIRRLARAVTSDHAGPESALPGAAIDAGPAAVPALRDLLRDKDDDIRFRAMTALAYIGGDSALVVLEREYRRTPAVGTKSLLCAALATRGTPEDRAFLARSLKGEHFGSEWMPIVSAALSLGILRAADSRGALEAAASMKEGLASQAAAQALLWLSDGRSRVTGIDVNSDTGAVVAAVLANGVPRMDEARAFADTARNGVWQRNDHEWTFRRSRLPQHLPEVSFVPHISRNGKAAVVSVSITFGSLNASGYDFVLWKDSSGWHPVAIFFTWIS